VKLFNLKLGAPKGMNKLGEVRDQNEKRYQDFKGDDLLENAMLCEMISDENFLWSTDEALYWSKKGIEIRESLFGKKSLENTPYLDKIVKILLEKGSYKEAIKWNKKSTDIKIKNKGEDTPEIVINQLYFGESMILLKKFDESKLYLDSTYFILEKNISLLNQAFLYESYLELAFLYNRYNSWAERSGMKVDDRCDDCGSKAVIASQELYGHDSVKTADAMRWKGIFTKNTEEALGWFKKSIKIYLFKEDNQKYAKQIFRDVRQKLEGQNIFNEKTPASLRWFYENSSEDFMLKAIDKFTEADKIKMKQILNLY
jgi:hypothetical protein